MNAKQLVAPWSMTANSWQFTTVYDARGKQVCQFDLEDWGVNEENQAELEKRQAGIAQIVAAAPEMLDALRKALNYLENTEAEFGIKFDSAEACRAAIAKAEGQP